MLTGDITNSMRFLLVSGMRPSESRVKVAKASGSTPTSWQ